jgi:hypothetical protein
MDTFYFSGLMFMELDRGAGINGFEMIGHFLAAILSAGPIASV